MVVLLKRTKTKSQNMKTIVIGKRKRVSVGWGAMDCLKECTAHCVVDYDILASLDALEDNKELSTHGSGADVDIVDDLFSPTK